MSSPEFGQKHQSPRVICFEACNDAHCFLSWLFQNMFDSNLVNLGVSCMPFTVLPHFYLPIPHPWDVPHSHQKFATRVTSPRHLASQQSSRRRRQWRAGGQRRSGRAPRWTPKEWILGDGMVWNDIPQASRPCCSSQNMEILDGFPDSRQRLG